MAELNAGKDMLPRALVSPILTLFETRGEVVVEGRRLGAALARQASALAIDLLAKLRGVRRNYIRVMVADVRIYKDQSLSALHDTAGVMLAQLDDQGTRTNVAVYPRMQSYKRGRFVSWEWDLTRVFNTPGWYADPITGQAKMAWGSSATFVGREYPQQWGLEYRFGDRDAGLALP